MEKMFYFSPELEEEERKMLEQKAEYFKNQENLPVEVVKPKKLVYNGDNLCVGYLGDAPDFPYMTLKELFSRENIERYHVDGHMLYFIARKVLYILAELCEKGIYAGFIDLSAIVVHGEKPEKAVRILHPEYFQAEEIPSSYPWYPSDSRLFPEELELFDADSQKKADAKLIYKILTASEKGNSRIPPNAKKQEISFLFWNILSREWKDYFLDLPNKPVEYEELLSMLARSIQEESSYMSPEERRLTEEREATTVHPEEKTKAYGMIAVLREAGKSLHDISKELYLLQEKIEQHPSYSFLQAFALGDCHPFVREFKEYPGGFRAQLAHVIGSYSFGEVLLMGAEVLEQAEKQKERPAFFFILLDGEVKNDAMFQASLKKLEYVKDRWQVNCCLLPTEEFRGAGFRELKRLCMK